MREHIDSAYKILSKVFQDGTYSNMALAGERVSDMSTRLVYGTLEENRLYPCAVDCNKTAKIRACTAQNRHLRAFESH